MTLLIALRPGFYKGAIVGVGEVFAYEDRMLPPGWAAPEGSQAVFGKRSQVMKSSTPFLPEPLTWLMHWRERVAKDFL